MFHDYLRGSLEALLFAAGEPLSVAKLAEIMQLDKPQVWELLSLLERDYEDEKRGLYLRKVAEGYQLCTKEQHYELIKQLARSQEMKLSNAAMETLAIIAFKQPVTRSEMEAIRGVKVDGVVNTLLEYGLISETGRKDSIGHPISNSISILSPVDLLLYFEVYAIEIFVPTPNTSDLNESSMCETIFLHSSYVILYIGLFPTGFLRD